MSEAKDALWEMIDRQFGQVFEDDQSHEDHKNQTEQQRDIADAFYSIAEAATHHYGIPSEDDLKSVALACGCQWPKEKRNESGVT